MKLRVTKDWAGPKGIMKPGDYEVPGDISRAYARCCASDGHGEIVANEVARAPEPFRDPGKTPAPENKGRGKAPSNK